MAGAGEGSFDRQEKFVLQEVAYSEGEVARNAKGDGGVAGTGIRQARSGICVRDLRARLASRSRLQRKEDLAVLLRRWGSVQVLMYCFLASS